MFVVTKSLACVMLLTLAAGDMDFIDPTQVQLEGPDDNYVGGWDGQLEADFVLTTNPLPLPYLQDAWLMDLTPKYDRIPAYFSEVSPDLPMMQPEELKPAVAKRFFGFFSSNKPAPPAKLMQKWKTKKGRVGSHVMCYFKLCGFGPSPY